MICSELQNNLSLYLYGELEFAREEQVEDHLAGCVFCQQALSREKIWHASLNSQETALPVDLLAECRSQLALQVRNARGAHEDLAPNAGAPIAIPANWAARLRGWAGTASLRSSPWPSRLAAAALLLMFGFGAGHWTRWQSAPGPAAFPQMAGVNLLAPYTRVRNIQPVGSGRVRLVLQQIRDGELVGTPTNSEVRQLLLTATKDPLDPAVRVGSVEFLSGQSGIDVRDALLASVLQDRNAAVRLKALEGLRPFAGDTATREVLIQVLQQDTKPEVRMAAIDVLLPLSAGTSALSPSLLSGVQQVIDGEQQGSYVRLRGLQAIEQVRSAPPLMKTAPATERHY